MSYKSQTVYSTKQFHGFIKEQLKSKLPFTTVIGWIKHIERLDTTQEKFDKWIITIHSADVFTKIYLTRAKGTTPENIGLKENSLVIASGELNIFQNEIQLFLKATDAFYCHDTHELCRQKKDVNIIGKKSLPNNICIKEVSLIASKGGSVYSDFEKNLFKFFKVTLHNTVMHGKGFGKNIALKISEINSNKNADVICIIRGGGLEELDYDELASIELLATIANSDIPIVTGIGHEDDRPLCDFFVNHRESTPTGVAVRLNEHMQNFSNYLHNNLKKH